MTTNRRIDSLDVLRGLTMALMVLVNNPGTWKAVYPPLRHAAWNGLTPTDCIFPTVLFVMGVSMYLSFRKSNFRPGWKVLRRTVLLIGIGLLLNYISTLVRGGGPLRFTGVLQRFGLCFGITAVLVCTVEHKWLPWIAALLLGAYSAILFLGSGYAYGPDNLLSRVDIGVFGAGHIYNDHNIDPEGLLSTLPSIAHTLIGFLVGGLLARRDDSVILGVGVLLVTAGVVLALWLPLNKKVWSPSFALTTCGIATLLLGLFDWLIDDRRVWRQTGFFKTFGTNAIYCYIIAHIVAWVSDLTGFHRWFMDIAGRTEFTSLVYALLCVAIVYLAALPLYRRKIFIKL